MDSSFPPMNEVMSIINAMEGKQSIDLHTFRQNEKQHFEQKLTDKRLQDRLDYIDKKSCCRDIHTDCTICLNMVTPDHSSIMTQCCHYYHTYCIKEWYMISSQCPECKKHFI
jgi:hypothetical protein